ncbi:MULTISPECIES: hypothetical protein [unclassified Sutcliffiella]|uniref:hypothetical protein n=1 Tax=unclassified Sutcliffiella TaxID=2837532 RepID=UPI0030D47B90
MAEKLCELHIEKSSYERLPEYKYEDLRKGIVCAGCGGMGATTISKDRKVIVCSLCSFKEKFVNTVLRTINEFEILFPGQKVTSKIIHDWCGDLITIRSIQRILVKHFRQVGHGKSSQYVRTSKMIWHK